MVLNPRTIRNGAAIGAGLTLAVLILAPSARAQNVLLQRQVAQGFNEFNDLIRGEGLQGVQTAISQCYQDQSYTPNPNTVIPCLALYQTAAIVVPVISAHLGQQTPLFFTQSLFQNRYHPTLYRVGFPDFVVENNIMTGIRLQIDQLLANMAHNLPQ